MNRVIAELRSWAPSLKYWEQVALERVVAGVEFKDTDYEELLRYLLEHAGLADLQVPHPTLRFAEGADTDYELAVPVQLVKISNMQNVNALVSGQTLTFSPGLTAIFGANASGKSGYARVLGCAGFTRGDQEVLPDVTRAVDDTVVRSADIKINDGTADRVINYRVGQGCPELASLYVFDSTSVRVHLTESNEFSFSPAGLSYLTRLAVVTDEVRRRLRARIEERSQPHDFGVLFEGQSDVSTLIAELGPRTDLAMLHQMAELSVEEVAGIEALDLEIASLKTQDTSEQVTDLTQRMDDLRNLLEQLQGAQEALGEKEVGEVYAAIEDFLQRRSAAQRVSADQFKSEYLTQTGGDTWRHFIEAARALAQSEGTTGKPYPQPESRCLLCQQPLSPQAYELLLRLWKFLQGEAQAQLDAAGVVLDEKRNTLNQLDLDFFDHESVSYRHLRSHNSDLLHQVESFVAACSLRRDGLRTALEDRMSQVAPVALPHSGISEVAVVVESLSRKIDELEKRDSADEIAKLQERMRSLRHRVILQENLSEIERYVKERLWAQKASRCVGTTRPITTKHNQLFKELVTDRYMQLFEQILKDLGRPLKVKIRTRGKKAETRKQIVLETDADSPSIWCEPDKVLSEGEKRAVALADFLTEVALDISSSGIVLDDPVTSLDLQWRELIASILAQEAISRQVIVFTHDLPFLYYLKKYSKEKQVNTATHWIKRGDHDGKPGYVYLNNSPALEREYRKPTRASESYVRAKDAPAEEQEALLRQGFGELRTTYEAFIIFGLLGEVVMRFEERISFGRLKSIVWDDSIVQEVVASCERLSRYIEGHLHSDTYGAKKPTPATLLREINTFTDLSKRLRALKKDKKSKHK